MQKLVEEPGYADVLKRLDINSASELLSFFYLDTAAVDKFVRNISAINSDDHPIIEYSAPKYLLQQQRGYAFYEMLDLSMQASLPVENVPQDVHVERDRMLERGKYFRIWGVPMEVFRKMLSAY
jgi:hypothetical protein